MQEAGSLSLLFYYLLAEAYVLRLNCKNRLLKEKYGKKLQRRRRYLSVRCMDVMSAVLFNRISADDRKKL